MLLEDYILDLSTYPASMIGEVCREYRLEKNNEFFPKIGALVALLGVKYRPLLKRRNNIEALLSRIDESHKIEARKPSLEDWEALRSSLPRDEQQPKPISAFVADRAYFESRKPKQESANETAQAV